MFTLLIFSSKCFNEVAPIILLVTNGLLITKAFAKVLGLILYFLAIFTYFFIAISPRLVWCLENLWGHNIYLEFFYFFPFMYFPLNLPPERGE